MKEIIRIKTVSELHTALDLEKPKHPLVAVYQHVDLVPNDAFLNVSINIDLYQVNFKMCSAGSFQYGRNSYDFQEGTMVFMQPGQVASFEEWPHDDHTGGWSLVFHPDLIRKSALGRHIDDYSFFSYDANEALHISEEEKQTLFDIKEKIIKEYSLNIDKHSQKLIVSNIELLLDYCMRYFDRQFYTRSNLNKDVVSKFERLLKEYYQSDRPLFEGIPSVKYCGETLNISPNYLSDLLKKETGRNAREHIHFFLVDRAKTQLLGSNETVSQIAFDLGFEYPQHFSKIFKKKTGMSPLEFRNMN